MENYCRNQQIVLRREKNGGLVFNPRNAVTIEVDKQALRMLELLDGSRKIRDIHQQVKKEVEAETTRRDLFEVLDRLLKHGFVIKRSGSLKISRNDEPQPVDQWYSGAALSAPEKVHLMVTSKCNLSCKGCYAGHVKGTDITLEQIKKLVDQLAEMRVFQLAIGGGEPLVREDIVEIARYTREKRILPNITTNGTLLTGRIASGLKPYIGKVQFSLIADGEKKNDECRSAGAWKGFMNGCQVARSNGIRFGVNVLITKKTLPLLPRLVELILKQGTAEINVLRPKPVGGEREWFIENKLEKKELLDLGALLASLQAKYNELNITVDCALSSLMDQLPEKNRQEKGIFGCVAGKRFVTVQSGGDVYPCSFLVENSLFLGNVKKKAFSEIWKNIPEFVSRLKTGRDKWNQDQELVECCQAIDRVTVQQ
ncbi:MAG: PqqD family peptide modification chaperone [Candidatus Hodarchaeales archaeon]